MPTATRLSKEEALLSLKRLASAERVDFKPMIDHSSPTDAFVLGETGEDAHKVVYFDGLRELHALADPAVQCKKMHRPCKGG